MFELGFSFRSAVFSGPGLLTDLSPSAFRVFVLQRVIAFVAGVFVNPVRLVTIQRKRHGPWPEMYTFGSSIVTSYWIVFASTRLSRSTT